MIGVIYALVAMGLSLIFGVLEIVNFAHGEFYMLGAMLAYFLTMNVGLGYWSTVVVVTAVAVGVGYVLYEALLASLRGRRLRAQHPADAGSLHGAAERRGVPLHDHAQDGPELLRAIPISSSATCACSLLRVLALGLGSRSPSGRST